MSKYIIGDIHGCFKTFYELVQRILKDGGKYSDIVLVGDLVDRGPDSSLVVEFVKMNKIDCVMGNHEQMMIDYFENKEYHPGVWMNNGGVQTSESYNGNMDLIKEHVEFLKTLPLYLEYPEVKSKDGRTLVVSHSYIDAIPNDTIDMEWFKQCVLWDRYKPLEDNPEIFNVLGHTPVEVPDIRSGWANVDTGCVFNRGLYTKLTCLKFPEMVVLQQDNIEC